MGAGAAGDDTAALATKSRTGCTVGASAAATAAAATAKQDGRARQSCFASCSAAGTPAPAAISLLSARCGSYWHGW